MGSRGAAEAMRYIPLDHMIRLDLNKQDDPQFIGLVSNILNACVNRYRPADVYVVDHCFDRKWQRFSGKVLRALGTWNRRLVVPPFDPRRVVSQPKCQLLRVAVLFLSLSGYLACTLINQGRYIVATLDAGSSREIRIWADVYMENCQRIYYEVRVNGQLTVPISFIDCRSEEPSFNLLHSQDRNLVGVVETRRPEVLVAINDFTSGETWPRANGKDSWEEKLVRGRRLRDRLKADHPKSNLVLSDEVVS